MSPFRRWLIASVCSVLLSGTFMFAQAEKSPLKTVADVPMPGPAVRFDYQSFDPTSNLPLHSSYECQPVGGVRHGNS
jgi:hypothetical protein